jgi:2-succinyl-5-enolpyruvyl-6-hydroxy-3-cyclohexene-1-carboxylate synthase
MKFWAETIIDQLIQQGVTYFCISPGSRSTPLAIAVSENPRATAFVHFDERGMAFHALGYAKATKKPAALIVTSGTAVGNLYPAVMEAHHSLTPLLILSADRPPELRNNGANQSCDQVKFFGDYVNYQVDLPCPDPALPDRYLSSIISHAVFKASHPPQGPVQINCMFREPFFTANQNLSHSFPTTQYETTHTIPSIDSFERWGQILSETEKGVIVIGSLSSQSSLQPIYALAEKLNWPILADITANARDSTQSIAYFEFILKQYKHLRPELILHFGDRLVSKTLLEWLDAPIYCLIAEHSLLHDPKHRTTHRICCNPSLFCEMMLPKTPTPAASWFDQWHNYSQEIEEKITAFLAEESELSEPGVVQALKEQLDPSWALFIANSMPIRDADALFFPNQPTGPIFANRGLSGIDGNIATAVGISAGCQKGVIALIGDLTALHDINSLAQVSKTPFPIIFIVINNAGGGIFSFLPVAEKATHFETFFATAHTIQFEKAAELFDLPYFHCATKETWEDTLSQALQANQSCLIEVTTDRKENLALHKKMNQVLEPTSVKSFGRFSGSFQLKSAQNNPKTR